MLIIRLVLYFGSVLTWRKKKEDSMLSSICLPFVLCVLFFSLADEYRKYILARILNYSWGSMKRNENHFTCCCCIVLFNTKKLASRRYFVYLEKLVKKWKIEPLFWPQTNMQNFFLLHMLICLEKNVINTSLLFSLLSSSCLSSFHRRHGHPRNPSPTLPLTPPRPTVLSSKWPFILRGRAQWWKPLHRILPED